VQVRALQVVFDNTQMDKEALPVPLNGVTVTQPLH